MKPMIEKLRENEPYNLFFTTVTVFPETLTQKNSIIFTDLLCPSLGELKCSLQLNFVIKIDWLMEQYDKMGQGDKPLTVMYGYEVDYEDDEECLNTEEYIKQNYPNVQARFVQTKDSYGIHHAKVGIFVYQDNSLRIVISTANLYSIDWNFYCNGLWISPLCPPLPHSSLDTAGAGPTNFKPAFLSYLDQYKDPLLDEWMEYVKRADFSAVKVCLVTSAPGIHKPTDWPIAHSHLHTVGKLLSLHCKLPGVSPVYDENTSAKSKKSTNVSKFRSGSSKWTAGRGTTMTTSSKRTSVDAELRLTHDDTKLAEMTGGKEVTSVEDITDIINRTSFGKHIKYQETSRGEEAAVCIEKNTVGNEMTKYDVVTSNNMLITSDHATASFSRSRRTFNEAIASHENETKAEQTYTRDESLSWEIITQASSIGSLGNSPYDWFSPVLLRSLASHANCRLPTESNATIKIIYPTQNDILNGYHGAEGGGCLGYWMKFNKEHMKWPLKYLHSWKADSTERSKATPHIKTYCRISPCLTKLAWFCLTSANISKSAWGSNINKDGSIYVRSYEVGVLFLPKFFGETYFQIKSETCSEDTKLFPIIYDLPLTPYGPDDEPCKHSKES